MAAEEPSPVLWTSASVVPRKAKGSGSVDGPAEEDVCARLEECQSSVAGRPAASIHEIRASHRPVLRIEVVVSDDGNVEVVPYPAAFCECDLERGFERELDELVARGSGWVFRKAGQQRS